MHRLTTEADFPRCLPYGPKSIVSFREHSIRHLRAKMPRCIARLRRRLPVAALGGLILMRDGAPGLRAHHTHPLPPLRVRLARDGDADVRGRHGPLPPLPFRPHLRLGPPPKIPDSSAQRDHAIRATRTRCSVALDGSTLA